jgi:hypothetical protein
MATPSLSQSLNHITNQLGQFAGTNNLKLSPQAYANWSKAINDFSDGLSQQYENAKGLADYGKVGAWSTAHQTVNNLSQDLTHPTKGFLAMLQQLQQYCEVIGNAITAQYTAQQSVDHGF